MHDFIKTLNKYLKEVGFIIIPIFQIRKWRQREVRQVYLEWSGLEST